MSEPFTVRIVVRGYELDIQGHLNQAVYLLYCEHARWESMRAAGITTDVLAASGGGPAVLENTMRYHRELRGGDEVDVTCEWVWGTGKTFRVNQTITLADGTLVADLTSVVGVIDTAVRKLVASPAEHFRSLAKDPAVLGF
ncbi:acyl-CoA thioesterase [Actinokineospora iranica]|uniref:Acyl-CoA thioester hydrolase n=1 Tax=Actinokineospora iranica TaxID=1271860 RepID=A0A1G6PJR4_9PSEU|nr:acyl-CoA thioesterase [Actinokineospora iranica]SDC79605.1 acyl-CoA thioester hydrolase [Actinokineospora iranica]